MGILNYETDRVSGEAYLFKRLSQLNTPLTVLDVGANIGDYATKIKGQSPTAQIFAFEPHPQTFTKLQEVANSHNFKAYNLACGQQSGQATLYDYANSASGSQHASLHQQVIEKLHHSASVSWQVDIITLDDFILQNKITSITLLKIDTEGNELAVLQGCKQALQKQAVDLIHFEFNEMNIVSRVFFQDFYSLLTNYTFYRLLPDGLAALGAYSPLFSEIFAYQNILAVRNGFRFEA